jgi:hypothetical protein
MQAVKAVITRLSEISIDRLRVPRYNARPVFMTSEWGIAAAQVSDTETISKYYVQEPNT